MKTLTACLTSAALVAGPRSAVAQMASVATPPVAFVAPAFEGKAGLGALDPLGRKGTLLPVRSSDLLIPPVLGRSLQAHFEDEINAKDSAGAIGDGSTDDTAALQAWARALNSASHGFLPCGTYSYTRTLVFTANSVDIRGAGPCSILSYKGAGDAVRFDESAGTGNNRLRNFQINADTDVAATYTSGVGLHLINTSDFYAIHIKINGFCRGYQVDAGNNINLVDPFFRGYAGYTAAAPGCAAVDLEPAASGRQLNVPNSVHITNHDLGGSDAGSNMEAGLRIVGADGVFMTTGHIGQVQNDVEIVRRADLYVQSVEIKGYLDGSLRAVYFAPPSPAASGTPCASNPARCGATGPVQIDTYQIDNQTGNAVESQDPAADFSVLATAINNVAGWGLYAPYAKNIQWSLTKMNYVGRQVPNTGAIKVGIVSDGRSPGSGTAGSVGGLSLVGNQFLGSLACLFEANVPAANLTIAANNYPGCVVQPGALTGIPNDIYPNGMSAQGDIATTTRVTTGGGTIINADGSGGIDIPRSGLTSSGAVQASSFKSFGVPGVSCSGAPTKRFSATNGIVTHC